MEAAAIPVEEVPYSRHRGPRARDSRQAAIRCEDCGTYYDVKARQAREIRNGRSRRQCRLCRHLQEHQVDVLVYVEWWETESGLSLVQIGEICSMMFHAEEVVIAHVMAEAP